MKNTHAGAQTITELMISIVIVSLLFGAVIGVFVLVKNIENYSIAGLNLQRDVNVVMNRIIRNIKEGASSHGLRSGCSFTIPSAGEVRYTGSDGNVRSYRLSGNSIIYNSPAQSPAEGTIYTAPNGSSIILRFWEPGAYPDHETIGVYIGVSRPVGNKTVSGSVLAYVNLRNVPK